ncbi:MAG TPA: hypothetical protein VH442_20385 [Micromonosporaceae bacterium]
MKLAGLMRLATPEMLARLRTYFPGTFNPRQAEVTALAKPTDTTALDALTFPNNGIAQANEAGRSAALRTLNGFDPPHPLGLTGNAVSGRVLDFSLSAPQPDDFRQRIVADTLGVDICP